MEGSRLRMGTVLMDFVVYDDLGYIRYKRGYVDIIIICISKETFIFVIL